MKQAEQIISDNFYQHCWKLTSQVPGTHVFSTGNLHIADCGLSCDTFNIINICNGGLLTTAEIQQAKAHFEQKHFAYTIWASENVLPSATSNILAETGTNQTNKEPGMLLDLTAYTLRNNDTFVNIRQALSPSAIQHYAMIVARNWQPPDQHLIEYYTKATPAILAAGSPVKLFVYYHQNMPMAAIELFVSDKDTVGIFNLSTLEEFRGQGVGTALITYVLNEAKKWDYSYAVLQASEDGIGIYKRLGFTTETYFYEFH